MEKRKETNALLAVVVVVLAAGFLWLGARASRAEVGTLTDEERLESMSARLWTVKEELAALRSELAANRTESTRTAAGAPTHSSRATRTTAEGHDPQRAPTSAPYARTRHVRREDFSDEWWLDELERLEDPSEPMRLDPATLVPGAPEFYGPYDAEDLERPEVIEEIQSVYSLNRSELERVNALRILSAAWKRKAVSATAVPKEEAIPESFAADALNFARHLRDDAKRRLVLGALDGLEYSVVRDEALIYLDHHDRLVRDGALEALSAFGSDPGVRKALRAVASRDPDHENREEARKILADD